MRYNVAIVETLQREIEVEANSSQEAIDVARDKYDLCEVVLDSSDFKETTFEVLDI